MERQRIERIIKKYGGDEKRLKKELLGAIKRGGSGAIFAGWEALKRFPTKEVLYEILRSKKPAGKKAEEAALLKTKAAKVARKKNFIDEKFLFAILENIDSKKLLKEIGVEYLSKNPEISNELLKRMISIPGLKNQVGQRLLKQSKNTDDLLIIEEEVTGKLQKEALKLHWKIGMKLEDFSWLLGFVLKSPVAEEIWEKGKESKLIENLSPGHLYDISYFTESQKVKVESINLMWIKRENLQEEKHIEYLRDNAHLVTIEKSAIVREWANKRLLSTNKISWERLLKIKNNTHLLNLKLEADKRALEKIQNERENLNLRSLERELFPWERERLKFLDGKIKEIEREIAILQVTIFQKTKEEIEPPFCQV